MTDTKATSRRTLSVPCHCGAKANEPCVNRVDGGRTLSGPHPSRIRRIEGRLSPTEQLIVDMREALERCLEVLEIVEGVPKSDAVDMARKALRLAAAKG